jgi:activator of HSP90 ATPase
MVKMNRNHGVLFPVRRRALAAGIALGTAAIAIADVSSDPKTSIHQEIDFKARPERLYEALLNEREFSTFTGTPAFIQRETGGAFTLIGGRITGRNIELVPNRRIVQAWRIESWPAGVYSIVRFELVANGSGTRIVFDHTGFPPTDREALSGNWPRKYWDPLHQYLDDTSGGWS